jgi:nucleotide-binding universal stress UspA family protein
MTVLVAFTPTPRGEAAFDAGLEQAQLRGEDLLLVNSPRSGAMVSADLASQQRMDELHSRADASGVRLEVRQEDHDGDIAEHVLSVATEVDATLVVIGLRRRTAVGKLILGSSGQRILLGSDRPVLAVKA